MLCLENNLLLLNIPRCASHTTEGAIITSDIEYSYIFPMKELKYRIIKGTNNADDFYSKIESKHPLNHLHFTLNDMYSVFGRKDSVGITRDYFDKFISSLKYFYTFAKDTNIPLIKSAEEITNDFIIDVFNIDFTNISEHTPDDTKIIIKKLIATDIAVDWADQFKFPPIFNSTNWWTSGKKLTYEFDISDLAKFKEFIENRYNKEIVIKHTNKSRDINFSNLIINDKLKNHIWNTFEKKYHTKKLF